MADLKGRTLFITGASRGIGKAIGLRAQVVAFENGFERAHKDHKGYASRERWARIALAAYGAPVPMETPKPRDGAVIVGGAGGAAGGAAAAGFDLGGVLFITLIVGVALIAAVAYARMRTP